MKKVIPIAIIIAMLFIMSDCGKANTKANTVSATGTFVFYDYDYEFRSDDGTLTWSFDKADLNFTPKANQQYTLTYSDNGTADIYDDILISVTEK